MSKLMIRESFVNSSKGYRFGDSEWYESYTDDKGRLFRDMQREYGRCVSRMYREPNATPVGWVFEKRLRYEDARGNDPERDFYTREVWVEVREVVDDIGDLAMLDLTEVA